jgi:glutamine amidotransferase
MKVAIVDYGSGNLRSAAKAFERAASEAGISAAIDVTSDPETVAGADRVVLPGVGAFADYRRGLRCRYPGLEPPAMREAVIARARPFLGICVGMQLMANRGREFETVEGLGWIGGEVIAVEPCDSALKIPHMGWNELDARAAHPLLAGLAAGAHAYFVHSYHFRLADPADLVAVTDYGGPLAAIIARSLAGLVSPRKPGDRSAADRQLPAMVPMTDGRTSDGRICVERVMRYSGTDLDDLCEATESAITEGGGFGWLKPPPRQVLENYWKGVLLVPERRLVVGRLDGVIAGSAQLSRSPRNNEAQAFAGTLTSAFVAPWARRRGIGRGIVLEIESLAREIGLAALNLDLRDTQRAAIRLYESLGYVRWGTHPVYARVEERIMPGHYYYKLLEGPVATP